MESRDEKQILPIFHNCFSLESALIPHPVLKKYYKHYWPYFRNISWTQSPFSVSTIITLIHVVTILT